jgi:hypothetical protein
MSDRPDYICCVERQPGTKQTYCGRPAGFEFVFLGLGHAKQSEDAGSRLTACEDCLVAAMGSTQDGYDWPNYREAA